jgi:hypothetical protein
VTPPRNLVPSDEGRFTSQELYCSESDTDGGFSPFRAKSAEDTTPHPQEVGFGPGCRARRLERAGEAGSTGPGADGAGIMDLSKNDGCYLEPDMSERRPRPYYLARQSS